jgi:hypothetical protein
LTAGEYQDLISNRVSSNQSLWFRETDFPRWRHGGRKSPLSLKGAIAETRSARTTPPIRRK